MSNSTDKPAVGSRLPPILADIRKDSAHHERSPRESTVQLLTNNLTPHNIESHSHQVTGPYGAAHEHSSKEHWEQYHRLKTPAAYRHRCYQIQSLDRPI